VLSHARGDDGGRAARLLMLDEFAALGHLSMVERLFALRPRGEARFASGLLRGGTPRV
jgi:type IV secretory pathway TraG/TraD family ATPase VirD4